MLVVGVPIQIATVVIASTTIDDYKVGSGLFRGETADNGQDGASVAGSTAIFALMILGYLVGTRRLLPR